MSPEWYGKMPHEWKIDRSVYGVYIQKASPQEELRQAQHRHNREIGNFVRDQYVATVLAESGIISWSEIILDQAKARLKKTERVLFGAYEQAGGEGYLEDVSPQRALIVYQPPPLPLEIQIYRQEAEINGITLDTIDEKEAKDWMHTHEWYMKVFAALEYGEFFVWPASYRDNYQLPFPHPENNP